MSRILPFLLAMALALPAGLSSTAAFAQGIEKFFGHFEGDNQNYRAPNDIKDVRENKDCIKRFAKTLKSDYSVTHTDLLAIDEEVQAVIDDAVAKAVAAPEPGAADLLSDVYIRY